MHIPHDGVVARGAGWGRGKAISVKPMKSKQLKQWNLRTNTLRIGGGNRSGSASDVYICVCLCFCRYVCVSELRMRVCELSALLKYLYIYIVNI